MTNKFSIEGDVAFIYVRHRGAWYKVAMDAADLHVAQALPGGWHLIRTAAGLRVKASVPEPGTPSRKTTLYLAKLLGEHYGVRVRYRDGNGLDLRRANLIFTEPADYWFARAPENPWLLP